MAFLRTLRVLLMCVVLVAGNGVAAPTEHQVKAVFLFNFSRFVEWPASAFVSPDTPFVIGVFGEDPFGSDLDEVARGEVVNGRPLVVRHIHTTAEARDCQILFIPESESAHMDAILAALVDRNTLTVSDLDGGPHGAMIRLVNNKQKIRLRIDVDSARAAGLTISSNLLRASEIIGAPPRS
jgi:hypothetical protein